jgi:DNA-binding NtrC family response regulator
VKVLSSMSWPGNVRELENLIQRLAIFAATEQISAEEVECERARQTEATSVPENSAVSLPAGLQD